MVDGGSTSSPPIDIVGLVHDPYQPPGSAASPNAPDPTSEVEKHRHGCVTAYLIFMIVANAATALVTLTTSDSIRSNLADMPSWGIPVLVAASVCNVVFAVLLFRWKKVGFYGLAASSVIALVVNAAAGLDPTQLIGGLVGVGILFGVLQIGSPNSAWSQLEPLSSGKP